MPAPERIAERVLDRLLGDKTSDGLANELGPRRPGEEPLPPRIKSSADYSEEGTETRRRLLMEQGIGLDHLSGAGPEIAPPELAGNIENFVGFARLPVGVIGPLRVNGASAHGDYYVPFVTTEGALVASYHRGAHVVSQAGGVTALCLTESVARAPCFVFRNLVEAGQFLAWALPRFDSLQEVVSRTSRHCRIADVKATVNGKELYLIFEYTTGDASGQNMVTTATEAICKELLAAAPVQPQQWFLEGNMSGDKKATLLAFTYARGKKVVAEAIIPSKLVRRFLHAEPEDLARYWQISILGGIQSGSIGVQAHYANALAAIFIACGQDAACVSEASVGITRMDVVDDGSLYVSVSLPNLIVGTVGGGTYLPTARECLGMMGCYGAGHARKFAEICAAAALAGEVSIIGALAAGDFGQAHATYGRKRQRG